MTLIKLNGTSAASLANRLVSLLGDGSLQYNRSDGLVKQASAQLPGAPRTFVHKCHGGQDSLVTSREAYEIAMRFFHGSHQVRLWLDRAEILRGRDWFGRSEFYFGVSIKPRCVDFGLFHVQAYPGDPLALFVHTGEKYLSDKQPATREQLEELARQGAAAAVQRPTPTQAAGPGGSGEWTSEVSGTGFKATFRVAVKADQ